MPFKHGNRPWNKGRRCPTIAASWTPERRRRQAELMRQLASGPKPERWITGPDPQVKAHRLRYRRSQAQARYWHQEWTLTWEDYLDLFRTAPGEWSRDANALNLTRIDTRKGWHIWNVRLMRRIDAMRRPTKDKHRIRPKGLGSKARGREWKRGGGPRHD